MGSPNRAAVVTGLVAEAYCRSRGARDGKPLALNSAERNPTRAADSVLYHRDRELTPYAECRHALDGPGPVSFGGELA